MNGSGQAQQNIPNNYNNQNQPYQTVFYNNASQLCSQYPIFYSQIQQQAFQQNHRNYAYKMNGTYANPQEHHPQMNGIHQTQFFISPSNQMNRYGNGCMMDQISIFPAIRQQCIYVNKKWTITDLPELINQYRYEYQTFQQSTMSTCAIPNSIQFKLNSSKTIWILRNQFYKNSILGVLDKDQVDLSFIFDITGRTKDCENAIFYSIFGYIQLDENKEMTYFLMACTLLSISPPFLKLAKFLESQQQSIDPKSLLLDNNEEILDIMLFNDYCFRNNPQSYFTQILQQYYILLADRNPKTYFITPDNLYNEKIKYFSQHYFEKIFLQEIIQFLIPNLPNNQYISIQQVEMFYKLLQFYYFNQPSDNPQQEIDAIFAQYYNSVIACKLSEEDQIECLKYLPKDQDQILSQLKNQLLLIQDMKQREKAFLRQLIARKAQNIQLSSYKEFFMASFKMVTGYEVPKEVQNQLDEEIQRF